MLPGNGHSRHLSFASAAAVERERSREDRRARLIRGVQSDGEPGRKWAEAFEQVLSGRVQGYRDRAGSLCANVPERREELQKLAARGPGEPSPLELALGTAAADQKWLEIGAQAWLSSYSRSTSAQAERQYKRATDALVPTVDLTERRARRSRPADRRDHL